MCALRPPPLCRPNFKMRINSGKKRPILVQTEGGSRGCREVEAGAQAKRRQATWL